MNLLRRHTRDPSGEHNQRMTDTSRINPDLPKELIAATDILLEGEQVAAHTTTTDDSGTTWTLIAVTRNAIAHVSGTSPDVWSNGNQASKGTTYSIDLYPKSRINRVTVTSIEWRDSYSDRPYGVGGEIHISGLDQPICTARSESGEAVLKAAAAVIR